MSIPSGPGPMLGPGGDDDPSAPGLHGCGPGWLAPAARLDAAAPSRRTRREHAARRRPDAREAAGRGSAPGRARRAPAATLAKRLRGFGITSVRDLLQHAPRRYESAAEQVPIAKLGLSE